MIRIILELQLDLVGLGGVGGGGGNRGKFLLIFFMFQTTILEGSLFISVKLIN